MKQTLVNFSNHMVDILNNPATTYKEKISILIDNFNHLITHDPQLVEFFLTQIINNRDVFAKEVNPKEKILGSLFFKQLIEAGYSPEQSINLYINFIGMLLVTIIGRPMIQQANDMSDTDYTAFINQRAKMIPSWLEQMFNLK